VIILLYFGQSTLHSVFNKRLFLQTLLMINYMINNNNLLTTKKYIRDAIFYDYREIAVSNVKT